MLTGIAVGKCNIKEMCGSDFQKLFHKQFYENGLHCITLKECSPMWLVSFFRDRIVAESK